MAAIYAADLGDLTGDLGRRQNPAVPGLGALGDLDFDHFDLRPRGPLPEHRLVKSSVGRSAAEIAGADLPNEVAARAMIA